MPSLLQRQDGDVDASLSVSMVAFTAFLGQLTTSLLGPNGGTTQTTIPSLPSLKADSLCNSTSGAEVNCDWSCEGSATSISEYNQTTRECFEECFSQDTCLQSTIQNYENVSICKWDISLAFIDTTEQCIVSNTNEMENIGITNPVSVCLRRCLDKDFVCKSCVSGGGVVLIASALAATSLVNPVGVSPALAAAALFGTGTAALGGNMLGQNLCLGPLFCKARNGKCCEFIINRRGSIVCPNFC